MFHDNSARTAPDIAVYQSTDQSVINDTLTDITDLSVSVVLGRTYIIKAVLFGRGLVTGIKVAFSGTATMTNFSVGCPNAVTTVPPHWTALDVGRTIYGSNGTGIYPFLLEGTFIPATSGTLKIQAAEQPSDLGSIQILTGSHMLLWRMV